MRCRLTGGAPLGAAAPPRLARRARLSTPDSTRTLPEVDRNALWLAIASGRASPDTTSSNSRRHLPTPRALRAHYAPCRHGGNTLAATPRWASGAQRAVRFTERGSRVVVPDWSTPRIARERHGSVESYRSCRVSTVERSMFAACRRIQTWLAAAPACFPSMSDSTGNWLVATRSFISPPANGLALQRPAHGTPTDSGDLPGMPEPLGLRRPPDGIPRLHARPRRWHRPSPRHERWPCSGRARQPELLGRLRRRGLPRSGRRQPRGRRRAAPVASRWCPPWHSTAARADPDWSPPCRVS